MVLSIHTRHDANVTVFDDTNVYDYLEIEKTANSRYFAFSGDRETFRKEFEEYVLPYIKQYDIDTVATCWVTDVQLEVLKELFDAKTEFIDYHHHVSHVHSAYMFTDQRDTDLVLSIDGGGDLEDYFHIYEFAGGVLTELEEIKVNLGKAYRIIGLLSPELYKDREKGYQMDRALSGKKMSLQSYGHVRDEYIQPMMNFYTNFMDEYDEENDDVTRNLSTFLTGIGHGDEKFLDLETARDVLATSQHVFEELVKEHLYPYLKRGTYNRLVIVGGCALNVTFNTMVNDELGVDIFTPPCANDCGISLGIAKQHSPHLELLQTPFVKTVIKNVDFVEKFRQDFASETATIEQIATYLAEGKVIATVVGDIEIGPRALGHRSYLASPLIDGMKNTLNAPTMKDREIWRPVAPMVCEDELTTYFDTTLPSPYMTFAPQVRPDKRDLLKEILHVDGSARVQTVGEDSWIYDLLKEFGKKTGTGILMNTSFNEKGHPLINDLEEAYNIFQGSDLDGIIIETETPGHMQPLQLFLKK